MTVLIMFVAPLAGRTVDKIGPRWLMGAAFMKNVYTIFDGGKTKRLGLASLRDEHNNGTESSPAVLTSGAAPRARPRLALLVALLLMVYH